MPEQNGSATGPEYVDKNGTCPFCRSKEIEQGIDYVFEGVILIFNGCKCYRCEKRWAESYKLHGWLERNETTANQSHIDTRKADEVAALKTERDRYRELLAENLTAWDGEEESVRDEHSDLIEEIRQTINGKP